MITWFAILRNVALLSFPLWGTAAAIAVLGILPKSLVESSSGLMYLPWGAGLLYAPSPIYLSKNISALGKLLIVVVYCIVAVPVIFITGWVSACAFINACH